ncbi:uncharacterized protein [Coffea arabica]|uniref:Uncharacterized protein n=1 Tax=Coffea arabica TaxID=13443 RepID=A0ABM4U6F2_COFAR
MSTLLDLRPASPPSLTVTGRRKKSVHHVSCIYLPHRSPTVMVRMSSPCDTSAVETCPPPPTPPRAATKKDTVNISSKKKVVDHLGEICHLIDKTKQDIESLNEALEPQAPGFPVIMASTFAVFLTVQWWCKK